MNQVRFGFTLTQTIPNKKLLCAKPGPPHDGFVCSVSKLASGGDGSDRVHSGVPRVPFILFKIRENKIGYEGMLIKVA